MSSARHLRRNRCIVGGCEVAGGAVAGGCCWPSGVTARDFGVGHVSIDVEITDPNLDRAWRNVTDNCTVCFGFRGV